jgi:hypothetical protein
MAPEKPITQDQIVRIFCGGFVTVAYSVNRVTGGPEEVAIFGMTTTALGALLVSQLTLAFPELWDMGPIGKSKMAPKEGEK